MVNLFGNERALLKRERAPVDIKDVMVTAAKTPGAASSTRRGLGSGPGSVSSELLPDGAVPLGRGPQTTATRSIVQERLRLEMVIPVYNEEAQLVRSVETVRAHLDRFGPAGSVLTIADNGSSDGTWTLAEALAGRLAGVRCARIPRRGRGGALKAVWGCSEADVVAYMDVDLSTDLAALSELLEPLYANAADIVIGSRLVPGARTERCLRRDVVSYCYNRLIRAALGSPVADAQCGFKAMTAPAAQALLPLVQDDHWFFDTELLVLADARGMRVRELPVRWVEDRDSRVKVVRTAWEDLRGIARLRRTVVKARQADATSVRRGQVRDQAKDRGHSGLCALSADPRPGP